jgi:hypothetical protein
MIRSVEHVSHDCGEGRRKEEETDDLTFRSSPPEKAVESVEKHDERIAAGCWNLQ